MSRCTFCVQFRSKKDIGAFILEKILSLCPIQKKCFVLKFVLVQAGPSPSVFIKGVSFFPSHGYSSLNSFCTPHMSRPLKSGSILVILISIRKRSQVVGNSRMEYVCRFYTQESETSESWRNRCHVLIGPPIRPPPNDDKIDFDRSNGIEDLGVWDRQLVLIDLLQPTLVNQLVNCLNQANFYLCSNQDDLFTHMWFCLLQTNHNFL